jgi:hypothetical protein
MPLWLPWHAPLMRHPNGLSLLRGPGGALAKDASCCCRTDALDCELFRGNRDATDVHDHLDNIKLVMGAWGSAPAWSYAPGSTDNECCDSLDALFELPIRDYDTADSDDWGWFGNLPGMYFPNCLKCHNCNGGDGSGLNGGTWAFLRAFCNECSYPYTLGSCRNYIAPAGEDTIWTVELSIFGTFNDACDPGAAYLCFEDVLSHSQGPKATYVWAKTESDSLTHVYSGHHTLELVETSGLTIGFSLTPYSDYYCQPPSTIDLYAGEEPP